MVKLGSGKPVNKDQPTALMRYYRADFRNSDFIYSGGVRKAKSLLIRSNWQNTNPNMAFTALYR